MIAGKITQRVEFAGVRALMVRIPDPLPWNKEHVQFFNIPDNGDFEIGQEVTVSISAIKCRKCEEAKFFAGPTKNPEPSCLKPLLTSDMPSESQKLEAELEPRPK